MTTLLPCPFCGSDIDTSDPDVLYPSGIWWRDRDDYRQYIGHKDRQEGDSPCFNIVCPSHCCVVSGDSWDETINRWNTRI